jgi:lipoyl(octanoyl) transferase
MSLDMSLHARAARSGHGYLRFYRWDPACLSFGRHEPALKRYDRERIEQRGLDTVRRPTGGRAVWHDRELTYAVAAPEAAMGSLRDTYLGIHHTIALALRALGAPVNLAPARRAAPVDAGACFAVAAGGEVVINAGKVVGSAQLRSRGALLQHGSVLLHDDQSCVREMTIGHAAMPDVRPLALVLGRDVGWEEVAHAISDAASAWSATWNDFEDEERLVAEAELSVPRFRDPAWTWQR